MKIRALLVILLTLACAGAYAQDGGVKGKVVSRDGRVALSNVKVVVEPLGVTVMTDNHGNFNIDQLPKGEYQLKFEAPEFENLDLAIRVDKMVKNLNSVVMSPDVQYVIDDAVFAEFDSDTAADGQSLPSSLSSSKDVFNNIASYKFSEMRFNVRGYDSQYSSIYLNGIRFNDAMTGYGPWSLWSGLNDATRNQEVTSGIVASDVGLGGIGGTTNYNGRELVGIIEAWERGDLETAREKQNFSQAVINVICNYRGNIVGGKRIMKLIGLDLGQNRVPFRNMTDEEEASMKRELEQIGFFERCNRF